MSYLFYFDFYCCLSTTETYLVRNAYNYGTYIGAGVYLYSDITDISLYHRENVAEIRIFGIGGLGGYIGKFYNSKIGFYTAYVGDYSQAFLIKINNREKYVMSCRHAEKIVEEVKFAVEAIRKSYVFVNISDSKSCDCYLWQWHLDVFVELEEADLFIMFDIRDILEKSCESKIDVFHLRDNLRDLLLKRIEQNGIYA